MIKWMVSKSYRFCDWFVLVVCFAGSLLNYGVRWCFPSCVLGESLGVCLRSYGFWVGCLKKMGLFGTLLHL